MFLCGTGSQRVFSEIVQTVETGIVLVLLLL